MRTALEDARATLASCLALNGAAPASSGGVQTPRPRAAGRPDEEQVLAYIREHPGARSEEMCRELGTEAARLRPVLHALRDEGRVNVEGKARATRYTVTK